MTEVVDIRSRRKDGGSEPPADARHPAQYNLAYAIAAMSMWFPESVRQELGDGTLTAAAFSALKAAEDARAARLRDPEHDHKSGFGEDVALRAMSRGWRSDEPPTLEARSSSGDQSTPPPPDIGGAA